MTDKAEIMVARSGIFISAATFWTSGPDSGTSSKKQ